MSKGREEETVCIGGSKVLEEASPLVKKKEEGGRKGYSKNKLR